MTKVSDLTLGSIVYHIEGGRTRKRSIKNFDIDRKEIKLGNGRPSEYSTFTFEDLNDTSLRQAGDWGSRQPPCVFFSKEEALQGLIVILKKFIQDDHDEIASRMASIKKAEKRLNLLNNS